MIIGGDKSRLIAVTIGDTEYKNIVPKNYKMDPETEELIYGDDLDEDMVVVTADQRRDEDGEVDFAEFLVRNRWCIVKRVRATKTGVYFIAVYEDGDKCIRQSAEISGWIVKKDSIPRIWEKPSAGANDMINPIISNLAGTLSQAFGQPRNQRSTIETHPEHKNVVHGVLETEVE